jgi:hypothetical protein
MERPFAPEVFDAQVFTPADNSKLRRAGEQQVKNNCAICNKNGDQDDDKS